MKYIKLMLVATTFMVGILLMDAGQKTKINEPIYPTGHQSYMN